MGERSQGKDRPEVPKPNLDFSHLIPDLKINSRKQQTQLIVRDMLVSMKTAFTYLKERKEICQISVAIMGGYFSNLFCRKCVFL